MILVVLVWNTFLGATRRFLQPSDDPVHVYHMTQTLQKAVSNKDKVVLVDFYAE